MDTIKMNLEIQCTDNSRVSVEKLYGYVIRAIAGVVANNGGIVTKMNIDIPEVIVPVNMKKEDIEQAEISSLRFIAENPKIFGEEKVAIAKELLKDYQ